MSAKSIAIVATALVLGGGAACAQVMPFKEVMPQKTWTVDVGAGVLYSGRRASGRDAKARIAPWLAVNYKDRFFADPFNGVGANLIKSDAIRVGVQVEPQFSAGHPTIAPNLDRPGFGANAGGYAYARLPGNFVFGGQVGHDVTGQSDGLTYQVTLAQQSRTPIGLLATQAYVRGADAKRARAYYGVTAAEGAANNLPAYTPSGGLQGAGVIAFMLTPIGRNLGAGVMANYERIIGDAADSPIIRKRNDFRVAFLVAKRFSWN
jgi:outer membrane scaffolding protein for murein synthesis (MipA/OmpV family)